MEEENKSVTNKAKNKINEKIKEKTKQLKTKILTQVMAAIWTIFQALLPIIIAIIIAMTLISAAKWLLDKLTGESASSIMQGLSEVDISEYIKIDKNKNLVFTKDDNGNELKDVILQKIRDNGMDPDAMDLTEDNLIQKIINAEIVTSYPNLGGDELQGIVNFYRRDYEEENDSTLMTFVMPKEFKKLKEKFEKSGSEKDWKNLKNVFTVTSETTEINYADIESLDIDLSGYIFIGDSLLGAMESKLSSKGAKVYWMETEDPSNDFAGRNKIKTNNRNVKLNAEGKFVFESIFSEVELDDIKGICLMLGNDYANKDYLIFGPNKDMCLSGIDSVKGYVHGNILNSSKNIPIYYTSVVSSKNQYKLAKKVNENIKKSCDTENSRTDEYRLKNVTYNYINLLDGYTDTLGYTKSKFARDDTYLPNEEGTNVLLGNLVSNLLGENAEAQLEQNESMDTLTGVDSKIVIATYEDIDGDITVYDEIVNYSIETSKYATPIEFLIAHLQTTNDAEYVSAITDMVINNSKINIVIQDQYKSTETVTYEKSSESDKVEKVSSSIIKGVSVVTYTGSTDTWIVKSEQEYVKEKEFYSNTSDKEIIDGEGENTVERWTITTINNITYKQSTTTVYETSDNDGNLIEDSDIKHVNNLDGFLFIGDEWTVDATFQDTMNKIASNCIYRGKKGKAAKYWLKKLPADLKNIKGICVLLGINDIEDTENMEKLIDKLCETYSDVPIYIQRVSHVGVEYSKATEKNKKIDNYNKKISTYCSTKDGVYYIDTTTILQNEDGFLNSPDYCGETKNKSYTLTDEGVDKWIETIRYTITGSIVNFSNKGKDNIIESNENKFLGLWKNSTGVYEPYYLEDGETVNEKALYNEYGVKVMYSSYNILPSDVIIESSDWFFSLLSVSERTQNHLIYMKYLMNVYTNSNNYGDVNFYSDIASIFETSGFNNVSGIYGGTIQEKVWFALTDLGYSEIAVSGAMGNIHYESGSFDPTKVEGGYNDSNGGIGICQWTNGNRGNTGRNAQLKAYATSKGVNWTDADTQVEFLIAELTGTGQASGYANKQLLDTRNYYKNSHAYPDGWANALSVDDATIAFCYSFERPNATAAINSMSTRQYWANKYYNDFKGRTRANSTDSRIGTITLSTQNANIMSAMLTEACRIADDNRYTYSQSNRYGEYQYDCSSLVYRLYKQYFNINVPTTTYGYPSLKNNYVGKCGSVSLQPGDILYRNGHVEIYIGNGNRVGAHSANKPISEQISVVNGVSGFTDVYRFIFD